MRVAWHTKPQKYTQLGVYTKTSPNEAILDVAFRFHKGNSR